MDIDGDLLPESNRGLDSNGSPERPRAELLSRIEVCERERSEGLSFDAFTMLEELREKYGL